MPDETKLYNFRLPIVLMERVRGIASKHTLSVTDVVLTKLRVFADEVVQSNAIPLGPPASEVANDLAHAVIELGDANKIIDKQAEELSSRTIDLDAARMAIASLEGRIVELESYTHRLAETLDAKNAEIAARVAERDEALAIAKRRILDCQGIEEEFHAAEAEIERLKKALSEKQVNLAIQTFRADPAMKAVDPTKHHPAGPVLSDPVPRDASGEAIGFNLKGQAKGKGKP
jgi:DNA repair exonuclease SbcCD ATPase subunit